MTKTLFSYAVLPGHEGRYLLASVSHNSSRSVAVTLRFHPLVTADPASDKKAGRMVVIFFPFVRARVCLDLLIMHEARGKHPWLPGVGIIFNSGPRIHPRDVRFISVTSDFPPPGLKLRFDSFGIRNNPVRGTVVSPRRPIVDEFGRLIPKAGVAGKAAPCREELPPSPLRTQGMTSGPRRKEGRFSVEKERGRFWIVSPSGERVFSSGINCVTPSAPGPTRGMERLFRWLPPRRGIFEPASRGGANRGVSHYTANLIRRYGADWLPRWRFLAGERLLSWGFNTVGNWSDLGMGRNRRLYYTINAAWWDEPGHTGPGNLFAGFPDVFSDAFARKCDSAARLMTRPLEPNLLGYFVHNEPSWSRHAMHLAELALSTGRAPATKRFLLQWLRERRGTGAAPSSADLDRMREIMADKYLSTISAAIRRHDPFHLLLGIRFAGDPPPWLTKPMKHMDVVTINSYAQEPDPGMMGRIHSATGKPLLIGEFHMGATDRNNSFYGLYGVRNQFERGVAFARYMERAADMPFMVGAHWFQYVDQPVLGRMDGENYNIGFMDVLDRPYAQLAAAARRCNSILGRIHAGKLKPPTRRPKPVPTGISW